MLFLINKIGYDGITNNVIISIYLDETECKYNTHMKTPALAGCYEGKKWYGFQDSRNSSKGTGT